MATDELELARLDSSKNRAIPRTPRPAPDAVAESSPYAARPRPAAAALRALCNGVREVPTRCTALLLAFAPFRHSLRGRLLYDRPAARPTLQFGSALPPPSLAHTNGQSGISSASMLRGSSGGDSEWQLTSAGASERASGRPFSLPPAALLAFGPGNARQRQQTGLSYFATPVWVNSSVPAHRAFYWADHPRPASVMGEAGKPCRGGTYFYSRECVLPSSLLSSLLSPKVAVLLYIFLH